MSVLSHFERIFPPPRYMMLPSAGVDISDASLKYIFFEKRRNKLRLSKWGEFPIPEGAVVAGLIENGDALTKTLREMKKQSGIEYVRVSLPEERAYVFETTVPAGLSRAEIHDMLELHLEENVPLSPRDASFDFDVIERIGSGEEMRVSVSAYLRDTVDSYYSACRAAGLMPLAFEIEAQAIARAAVDKNEECAHLIVDFGKARTGIGIIHHGALIVTTTVDIGGKDLDSVLKSVVSGAKEEELTRIKNEEGLLDMGNDERRGALLGPVAALRDELATRISYWNVRSDGESDRLIKKVILCGGSANLAGLSEYLSEELGIDTERIAVWQNAFSLEEVVPPIPSRQSYGYATAIGLALGAYNK